MTTIILFAPLIGALLCGFGHKFMGEKAATLTATGLLFLACFFSWIVFLGFGGEILVGDRAVADATQGDCKILTLDPVRIASGEPIVFSGALDIVTFVDRRDYGL